MSYDYNWLRNHYYRNYEGRKNELICGMFKKIDSLIDEENIQHVYPKYLFVDGSNLELYLFLKSSRILKCSINDENYINISTFYISNIENVIFAVSFRNDRENKLSIKFNNNEIFEFDSKKDTNDDHTYGYGGLIQDLCKYINNV